ncbi:putative modified peptide [Stenotrophomonas sp. Br8]|uniref:NHLP-related RiPP peptide n=1 Tax=Stenotrophomonas TaxID=40323 RepID=UPI0013FE2E57|nr:MULTISPECIES: NHLP-related RiPP peptide [Stenotrophomonas]MBD3683076.1 putative modified peptide [Stenotrophomonas sp. Br8]
MYRKPPLSTDNAVRLLDLLCDDDAFRNEFSVDPSAALVRHGLQPMAGGSPCAIHGVLASKEEFSAVRSQLVASLICGGPFNVPFMFESEQLGTVLSPAVMKHAA